ncbi:hypothetical protein ACPDHL_02925 [Myroides sp. C15-4]|uniref:hypothetical protein n=1 Tax=Myroides sp. C15-4 TaxID=3400532 RepID=UPI003D2F5824
MKAVIVKEKGKTPVFVTDFKHAEISSSAGVFMRVQAVAIKNLDRAITISLFWGAAADLPMR